MCEWYETEPAATTELQNAYAVRHAQETENGSHFERLLQSVSPASVWKPTRKLFLVADLRSVRARWAHRTPQGSTATSPDVANEST